MPVDIVDAAWLAEALERRVGDRGAAGIAVAAGDGGPVEIAWAPQKRGEEPAFLAYSITKTFIAAIVLQLRDEGRIELDQTIARWLPRIEASERISLRQLLSHSAGLRDYGGLAAYHRSVRDQPGTPWTFERFTRETLDRGLLFEPGERFAYSNPGYMLLKRIAEEVAGRSFAELVAGRIAAPLGLHRTAVAETPADLSRLAPAPSRLLSPDGRPLDVREHYHPGWVSHGVVASTPSEIARFYAALFAGRVVAPRSLGEMTQGVPVAGAPPRWRRPCYGLGLMGDRVPDWGALWGHGGSGPGTVTGAFHGTDPTARAFSVCAMCAVEEDDLALELVFAVFDRLRTG